MLSDNDINHINLLYEQYSKIITLIHNLVKENNWDSVINTIKDKEVLMKKIMSFERPHIDDIKSNQNLLSIRKSLIKRDAENLNLIKELRKDLFIKITQVKKSKKVLNAYEPITKNTVSTFEVKDIDEE